MVGCIETPTSPDGAGMDGVVWIQDIDSGIVSETFTGIGVTVEYYIKNNSSHVLDNYLLYIEINTTNGAYVYDNAITDYLITNTVTNTIFIDTGSNNYTNLQIGILAGYTE